MDYNSKFDVDYALRQVQSIKDMKIGAGMIDRLSNKTVALKEVKQSDIDKSNMKGNKAYDG